MSLLWIVRIIKVLIVHNKFGDMSSRTEKTKDDNWSDIKEKWVFNEF